MRYGDMLSLVFGGAGGRRTALKGMFLLAITLFLPVGQLHTAPAKAGKPSTARPHLDVLITTNLKDPAYAKKYLKSLELRTRKSSSGFRSRKITLGEGEELGVPANDAAPYLLVMDHIGSISVGDKYRIVRQNDKTDLARSSDPTLKVGRGYYYEWYVHVTQEGTVRFRLLKNAGDKYLQLNAWSMRVEMPQGLAEDRGYVRTDGRYLLEEAPPEAGPVSPLDKDAVLRRLAPILVPEDMTLEGQLVSRSIVKVGMEKDGKVPVTLSIRNHAPWAVQANVADSEWSEAVAPGASGTVTVLRSGAKAASVRDKKEDSIGIQFSAD